MKITFPLLSLLSPPQRLSLPFLQQLPSLRLPLLLLSLLLPVTESTMFTIVTGVAFDGDNLTSVEKKRFSLVTWSGPKSRSPRVPFSPMSMPLAISSTLALAAATLLFTLSASWLRRLLVLQRVVYLVEKLTMAGNKSEKSATWEAGLPSQQLVSLQVAM